MRMWFFSERSPELANTLAKTVDVKRSLCGCNCVPPGLSILCVVQKIQGDIT